LKKKDKKPSPAIAEMDSQAQLIKEKVKTQQ
jgi:hypothetical protein